MSKEEQFDFYWKEIFTGLAYNPIEFNTYRFDQSMSLPSKFNKLYDMLKVLALNNQEVMDYLKEFVETFDFKLETTVKDVLVVWLNEGLLADVVREAINEEVIDSRGDYDSLNDRLNGFDLKQDEIKGEIALKHDEIKGEFKSEYVSLSWFKRLEGETDDTNLIQRAIKMSYELSVPVKVPSNTTYRISEGIGEYDLRKFYGNGVILNNGVRENFSLTFNSLAEKWGKAHVVQSNTYGTLNSAATHAIMSNANDAWVSVLGIRTNRPEDFTWYNNRDSVSSYIENSATNNYIDFDGVTYDKKGVTIPSLTKDYDIPINSIIDTKHSPYYSGIVKNVDYETKYIEIYKGWYKFGGTKDLGQIPPSGIGLTINKITKIWNSNWNLFFPKNTPHTAGCSLEIGVHNHQAFTDNKDGLDIISAGSYGANTGIIIRSTQNGNWYRGVHSQKSNVGLDGEENDITLRSTNADSFGVYVIDAKKASYRAYSEKPLLPLIQSKTGDDYTFEVDHYGRLNSMGYQAKVVRENNETVKPYLNPFILVSGSVVNVVLDDPKWSGYRTVELINLTKNEISITARLIYKNTARTSIGIPQGKTGKFISDGGYWYPVDYSESLISPV